MPQVQVPSQPTDSKMTFIKFTRGISYLVYAYALLATIILVFAFFLLLFGANTTAPFVQFIYNAATDFMAPFRGIFPIHEFGSNSYFAPGILFAIIIYLMFCALVNSAIDYLNVTANRHQAELKEAYRNELAAAKKL